LDVLSAATWDLTAGFLLGAAFGATVQRTGFCTMGALADAVLFGDGRRLRAWLLAIAIALLGSALLQLAGWIALGRSLHGLAPPSWLGVIAGGLLFGFGMTQTGGCLSKCLVRAAGGSLRALVVLLIAIPTAVLAALLWLRLAPYRAGSGGGTVGAMLADATGTTPSAAHLLAALALGGALLAFCLADRRFRRAPRELAAGLILGLLVPLGWLVTLAGSSVGASAATRTSFNVVMPFVPFLFDLAVAGDLTVGPAMALILGTPAGALAMALAGRSFRIERFADAADRRRHVAGALLMGVGGALALGCTVGQGISGVSTLAPASIAALLAMMAGGVAGIRYLEQGSLAGAVRALFAAGREAP